MTIASSTTSDTTAAALEFALLQSWLASSSALQLPLHQIESLQQAKGREVQRLLLQAHLQHRGNGDVGLALCLQQQDGAVLYSHRRLGTRSRLARLAWKILHDGVNYIEQGQDTNPRAKKRRAQKLTQALRKLGYSVT